jgi:hypothetical protein
MCLKNNRQCPGYAQSFKWSTKHEKSISGRARGPSNLKDLVTATSKTIPRDKTPKQNPPEVAEEQAFTQLDPSTADHSGSDGCSSTDLLIGGTDGSLSPILDNLMLPEYDYGIEDLLQDIWQDNPRSASLTPSEASRGDPQLIDQSLCLVPISAEKSPFTPWNSQQMLSPPYQPIFSQIPRNLNDRSSLLVEEWFRRVCSMWSSFDSNANLNRKFACEAWTRSTAVMNCLQSMSATCLSTQMPQMRNIAVSYLKAALRQIQKDLQAAQAAQAESFPTDVLLALCCVGTAACWIDTREIGGQFLREAKSLLKRLNRDSSGLSIQDQQSLSFFNNSVIYWNMLVSVVSDEKDDIGVPSLKEPENRELSHPIVPHPWTGISATAQQLFTQAVRLCRRFRRHLKRGTISTMKSLQTALKDIKEAQEIEEELLALKSPDVREISDTGDMMTPKSHFINIAEGYRLASLLQLYQTFPDLVATRLPGDAIEAAGFVPWDNWIVPLSIELVNTLKRIPVSSGTRCIQPLLYLSASTGLRFDEETMMQQQRANPMGCNPPASMGTEPANVELDTNLAVDGDITDEPQIIITRLSIEVTYARQFVMERLSSLEHSLPPAPILVAKDLVRAIWSAYDLEVPGSNYTHWIDVMEDSDLRTIFG